jgi:hypothetical protein
MMGMFIMITPMSTEIMSEYLVVKASTYVGFICEESTRCGIELFADGVVAMSTVDGVWNAIEKVGLLSVLWKSKNDECWIDLKFMNDELDKE